MPVTGSSITRAGSPNTSSTSFASTTAGGGAGGVDAAVAHRDEVVGVAAGLVEVVQDHHDRAACSAREVRRAGRAPRPGGRGRGRWSARRAAGSRSPGPASSRSTRAGAGRRRARRAGGRRSSPMPVAASARSTAALVVRRPLPQQRLVRVAAARDEVLDRQALRGDRRLRQQPEPAGDLLGRQRRSRRPSSRTAPDRGASSRASARSSVDLPQPLAPTIAVMRPRGIVEVELVHDLALVVGERERRRRAVEWSLIRSPPDAVRARCSR